MAHYSKEDCTFILKTLSAGVVDALDRAYDYDGTDIYQYLNMRLNRAVGKANAHSKKLVAELMIELNKATDNIEASVRKVTEASHIDVFMTMIRNVVINIIKEFEVTRNEVVITDDNQPIHIVDVAFVYDASVWLITVTDQDMSDKYERLYRINGVLGAELSEEDSMVLALLSAISSLTAVEKETELMVRVAAADPIIVQKAEEIQKVFGKSVEEHLEVALIFHSLTDYSAIDTEEAKNMAVYIRHATRCSPQQAVNPSFIQSEFGFSKDQAKVIAKIFGKRKGLPFGWKLFAGKDANMNNDDSVLEASYKDLTKKDGGELDDQP